MIGQRTGRQQGGWSAASDGYKRRRPRVSATSSVSLAGLGSQEFTILTSLEAETGLRLKETYSSLTARGPASLRISRPRRVGARRLDARRGDVPRRRALSTPAEDHTYRFGRDVDVPANLRYSRKLYVTFLDDELMIMRDESGVPDVLLRKGAPEGAPTVDEGVPSADDEDDVAPGA